jgi:hypothetical protein
VAAEEEEEEEEEDIVTLLPFKTSAYNFIRFY